MIAWLLAVLRARGEAADPVDEHYLTAVAALCPDQLLSVDEDAAWWRLVESYHRRSYTPEEPR